MLNAEMVHQVLAAGTRLCGFLFLCLGLQVQVGEVTNSYTDMKINCFQRNPESCLWYRTMTDKKMKLTQQQEAGIFLPSNRC